MNKGTIITIGAIAVVLIIITYTALNDSLRRKIGQKIQASTGFNPYTDIITMSTVKRNNPLNIRHTKAFSWQGEITTGVNDGDFAQFDTLEHGIRAAIVNLHTYITKDSVNTIHDIINKWAPPIENDDVSYEETVMKQLPELNANDTLDGNYPQLAQLAWAMSAVELGFKNQPSKDTFISVQQKYFPQ